MEITHTASARNYDFTHERLSAHRSLNDYHQVRRLNRLGAMPYRSVRQARKNYLAAKRRLDDLFAQGAEG